VATSAHRSATALSCATTVAAAPARESALTGSRVEFPRRVRSDSMRLRSRVPLVRKRIVRSRVCDAGPKAGSAFSRPAALRRARTLILTTDDEGAGDRALPFRAHVVVGDRAFIARAEPGPASCKAWPRMRNARCCRPAPRRSARSRARCLERWSAARRARRAPPRARLNQDSTTRNCLRSIRLASLTR
jgi:hypothetical protein